VADGAVAERRVAVDAVADAIAGSGAVAAVLADPAA
jgi:hypothetical protein